MLHAIKPVLEAELQAVVAFQRLVLAFACRDDLVFSLTPKGKPRFHREQVDAHFGPLGDWVWRHTSLCTPVRSLHDVVKGDSQRRSAILEAFDNDVLFDRHIEDSTFRFAVPLLRSDLLGPLTSLLELFYELLGEPKGFPEAISGGSGVSREAVVQAFWRGNADLKVCPACDGKKPDSIGGRVYGDCDHYFPKAIYPALSVHPLNLVPICKECNSSFKLQRDALDKCCLAEMFLPYRSAAFGPARVIVSRSENAVIAVSIEDDQGARTARVIALEYVYQLPDRWVGRLHDYIASGIQNSLRRQMEKWHFALPSVSDAFLDQREAFRSDRGRIPDAIASEAYCDFAAGDKGECDALLSQLPGRVGTSF